ncbi:hypothetical protein Tco_0725907 [Tanacetum coccineum]|uniref:Uncharacterized protein n=1 Tax=Tanacetum coccineum TaxID=301880 RepID=A0ABQ4YF15_9ASTR
MENINPSSPPESLNSFRNRKIYELNALLESLNLTTPPLERDFSYLEGDIRFVELFKEYEIGDLVREKQRRKKKEVKAIKEIEKRLKEREIQQQESLVTEGTTLEVNLSTDGTTLDGSLVTEGTTLDASLVTKGISLDASLVAKQSTIDSTTSSEQQNESNGSRKECSRLGNEKRSYDNESKSLGNNATYAEKILVDTVASDIEYADIGPSYDSDTVSEVHHDTFKNVFTNGIQNYEQHESKPGIYVVNENNSNIISDIPNMDPDRDCEAQQANALLTKELERYKEKEKYFANDKTIESEYCKKIKLLNDKISNLKSQAYQNDKTFARENRKYDEYVQPLLKRKNELEKKNQEFLKQINDLDNKLQKIGETAQTLHMFLPKEDSVHTRKHGIGFENQNDVENPFVLNKAKELTPSLYDIDKMGQDVMETASRFASDAVRMHSDGVNTKSNGVTLADKDKPIEDSVG